jgi:hypothetical protein
VLPLTTDPYEIIARFGDEFAGRQDYVERYRSGYGFHPVHSLMATFPLKRLRHAGRVIVAGIENPALAEHLGFGATTSVEEALAEARSTHGREATVALVRYPMGVNRQ